jgi:hypothetical protein
VTNLDPRLHARALFRQDDLAAGDIDAWSREQERDLEREDMLCGKDRDLLENLVRVGAGVEERDRPITSSSESDPSPNRLFTRQIEDKHHRLDGRIVFSGNPAHTDQGRPRDDRSVRRLRHPCE